MNASWDDLKTSPNACQVHIHPKSHI